MVTAFVLINVEDIKVREIAANLEQLEGVKEVHVVAGEYDLVAVIRVTDNHKLSEIITEKILHTKGVHRTKTLFAIQSFSRYNIEKFFDVE